MSCCCRAVSLSCLHHVSWSECRSGLQCRHLCAITPVVGLWTGHKYSWTPIRCHLMLMVATSRHVGRTDRTSSTPSCLFCPLCFIQRVARGLSSWSNVMGRSKWGVTEHHRDSAIIFNSSCWIFLTWIYQSAFYSHVNCYHPQLHLVRSSAI